MLLGEMLKNVEKSDLDEKLKIICDEIMKEESVNFTSLPESRPKGANIFLAVEVMKNKSKDTEFLCLEREFKEKYIISLLTVPIRRKRVWPVTEETAEKILKKYAETLKYVRGE